MPVMPFNLLASTFNRAKLTYDNASVLQQAMAEELLSRLPLLTMTPDMIVDLGSGTGSVTQRLMNYYSSAHCIALDVADQLLQAAKQKHNRTNIGYCQAQAPFLPLRDHSVDMVFSNASIQWCGDVLVLFNEIKRILKPGGLFMFSTFGPDTLFELKRSFATIDDHIHINDFHDMHTIGDQLSQLHFSNPVMDRDTYQLTYATVLDLLRDLRGVGSRNLAENRFPYLRGKRYFQQLEVAYKIYQQDDYLPATYEVIFGHAFSFDDSSNVAKRPRHPARVSVSDILKSYKSGGC